jgi:hypothetical protein
MYGGNLRSSLPCLSYDHTKHAEPIIPPIKNGIGAPKKNRRQPPNKLPENRPKLDFNV